MTSDMEPLVLHAHGTGPNPYKVAIALEILHLPYTVKLWQFGDGPGGVKSAEFLKINKNGRVPALEDPNTGVVSWESGACLNYLVRAYDKQNVLGPKDDEQSRVDYDKWTFFLVSTLGPMMGQVNWFRHYHPVKNEDALKRYEEQAYRCYGVLESQLQEVSGQGAFILGGTKPSTVDLHFYPWVYQHSFAQLSLDQYPGVKKWLDAVGQIDEVKKAYAAIPKGQEV